MSKSTSSGLRALTEQVRGNVRLQAGLAVIGLIVLWLMHDAFSVWAGEQSARHADARTQLTRMQALVGESEWAARAAEASQLAESLEAELQPAEAEGLAQAHLQTQAMRWLRAANLEGRSRLQAATPAATSIDGVWAVPMTISGEGAPRSVLELVKQIESQRQLAVIDDLRYTTQATGTFNVRVRAFYRIAPETGSTP